MKTRPLQFAAFAALAALLIASAACSKAGIQTSDVFRAGKDGVSIAWETDKSGAVVPRGYDHPVQIPQTRFEAILGDLDYEEHAFFQWRERGPMFDEREIKKIGRAIVEALSKCTADQWVSFEVISYKRDLVFKSQKLASGWVWVKDGKLNLVFGNFLFETSHDDDPYGGDPRLRWSMGAFRIRPDARYAAPPVVASDPLLAKEHSNWAMVDLATWQPRPKEDTGAPLFENAPPPAAETVPTAETAPPATVAPAEPPPAETAPSAERSVEERLRELQNLLDKGLITPEEYEVKRREILGAL